MGEKRFYKTPVLILVKSYSMQEKRNRHVKIELKGKDWGSGGGSVTRRTGKLPTIATSISEVIYL